MADDDMTASPPPMERPSRPKESERTTRKPLAWWDRVKLLLLFATVWVALVLGAYFRLVGAMSRYDAFYYAVRMYPALLVLFSLELVRQIHYLLAEHWKRYYAFWNRLWVEATVFASGSTPGHGSGSAGCSGSCSSCSSSGPTSPTRTSSAPSNDR